MSLPLDYRDYFVRNLHDALSGHASSNVQEAVKFSEQSRTRCIGLTIETRPDYCLTPHLTQVGTCLTTGMPAAGCRKACMPSLTVTVVRTSSTCRLHPDRRGCTNCKLCCTLFGYAYWPSAKACACHPSSISNESCLAATYCSEHIMHQQVKQRYAVTWLPHADAVIRLHKARDWPAKHL